MIINAIVMMFNEASIAPYFLSHYQDIDEVIVLLETDSTDNTLEICRQYPNVTVKLIHVTDGIDDDQKVQIINDEIKNQVGKADWVYVLDPDELIVPYRLENPYDFLDRQWECDAVVACMYQVYRHVTDKDLDPAQPALPQRLHGDLDLTCDKVTKYQDSNIHYCKPIVVRPEKAFMEVGNHRIIKDAVYSKEFFIGSHWQHADPTLAVTRRLRNRSRLSRNNLNRGYGFQNWEIMEEDILAICESHKHDPLIGVLSILWIFSPLR